MNDVQIAPPSHGLTPEQIHLIKATVAKNCTDQELQLFLHACRKTGLDPLMKQIYAVKRGNTMSIQTGIDGFRLIAERTGKYAPGREPTYQYINDDPFGEIISATAYVKKMTEDGTWHEIAATARFDEYNPGGPFWQKMKHVMIAKVAESLALRRAFPMELSGVYSTEEMSQADVEREAAEKFQKLTPYEPHPNAQMPVFKPSTMAVEGPQGTDITPAPDTVSDPPAVTIGEPQRRALEAAIRDLAEAYGISPEMQRQKVKDAMGKEFSVEHFADLTPDQFEVVFGWVAGKRKKARA